MCLKTAYLQFRIRSDRTDLKKIVTEKFIESRSAKLREFTDPPFFIGIYRSFVSSFADLKVAQFVISNAQYRLARIQLLRRTSNILHRCLSCAPWLLKVRSRMPIKYFMSHVQLNSKRCRDATMLRAHQTMLSSEHISGRAPSYLCRSIYNATHISEKMRFLVSFV